MIIYKFVKYGVLQSMLRLWYNSLSRYNINCKTSCYYQAKNMGTLKSKALSMGLFKKSANGSPHISYTRSRDK